MREQIMNLKDKVYHWLFMNGFFREVIIHYGNGGIDKVHAFGFSLRRRWRETRED